MQKTWIDDVRRLLRCWQRRGLGDRWVVAVSGGSDSVALLRVLHRLAPEFGLSLSVAHLNHGVRGNDAQRDAEFVGDLAQSLNLPFDLGHWAPIRAAHFEADARSERYRWLAEVAENRGASVVAVGHTLDDQAETILHRILRGTGPRGLAGIPRRRALNENVTLVRPLLGVCRVQLRDELEAQGQSYREDASNADLSRTRARIRHDLLPQLAADYNPRVVESLVRLGRLVNQADSVVLAVSRELVRTATVEIDSYKIVLKRQPLTPLPRFQRADVVRLAWRQAGWPERAMRAEHWDRIARWLRKDHGRTVVATGVMIAAGEAVLTLTRPEVPCDEDTPSLAPQALTIPGSVSWLRGRVEAIVDLDSPHDELIDRDAVVLPLCIRAPRDGDRWGPLGMHGGTMSLNDFLRGRRVPRFERASVPLVCDTLGIIWVVGHRIADRVRIGPQTQRTLGLRWLPCETRPSAD